MADTSSGRLALVKESVAGVTPATPGFQVMDFTSETLKVTKGSDRSKAVSASRLVGNARTLSMQNDGTVNWELVRGPEMDLIWAGLLCNAFSGSPGSADAGGNAADTFTIERRISDTMLREFVGTRLNTIDMTIAPEAYVTMSLGVLGASGTSRVAPITGATYAAASPNEKLVSLDTALIAVSGITGTFDFQQISIKLDNNLAASKRLGPSSTRKIRAGQAVITGQLQVFVDSNAFYDAYIAETPFAFETQLVNAAKGYGVVLQRCRITDYEDGNSGNGNEFVATIGFEATLDSVTGKAMTVSKIGV